MERTLALPQARVSTAGLPLRLSDVVLSTASTLALVCLLFRGRWVPGWERSAAVYLVLAVGPILFRALFRRFPKVALFDAIASFWLLPAAVFGHAFYGPVVDSISLRLFDPHLAAADLRLFGVHPSAFLSQHVHGVAMDLLLACYYTYFLWPAVLGAKLFFGGRREVFDHYALALALCFCVNFAFYALIPAVGPRYFLAGSFDGSLKGWIFTPYLESLLRRASFARDCFPSGHTAGTLLVLTFAHRHWRKLFWVMLPVAAGLITATLAGRFHYGIDLVCAIPMVIWVKAAASYLTTANPKGVWVGAREAGVLAGGRAGV